MNKRDSVLTIKQGYKDLIIRNDLKIPRNRLRYCHQILLQSIQRFKLCLKCIKRNWKVVNLLYTQIQTNKMSL